MEDIIYCNGAFIENGKVAIPSSNRSFRYGDGLFESILITDGDAPLLSLHIDRLLEGLQCLHIDRPQQWTLSFFSEICAGLIARNRLEFARCRLTVWREGGGWYLPESDVPSLLVEMFPHHKDQFDLNSTGLSIGIFREVPKLKHPLSACKTANALPYVLAARYAHEQNWNDAVVLNQDGDVADAISSNIFIRKDVGLFTPAKGEGGVAGVMRQVVLHICHLHGIVAEEKRITVEELMAADEIIFTNAIHGIRWVGNAGKSVFQNNFSAQLVQWINEAKNNHTLVPPRSTAG